MEREKWARKKKDSKRVGRKIRGRERVPSKEKCVKDGDVGGREILGRKGLKNR